MLRGGSISYIHIDMLRIQAQILQRLEEHQGFVPCEWWSDPDSSGPCGEPAEYLVPDAIRAGAGDADIEIRPAWFCRSHLSERLGHDPGEQPFFRHIEDPEE